MNKEDVLDRDFIDARHKLLDVAAFLDRLERAQGADDFRADAFRKALVELASSGNERAKRILEVFSDPTDEPIEQAGEKGACGAYPPEAEHRT